MIINGSNFIIASNAKFNEEQPSGERCIAKPKPERIPSYRRCKINTGIEVPRSGVSCADVLALVARDAISLIHGPFWVVPLGRRDGRVSIMTEALTGLPHPFGNVTLLKTIFASKGLSVKVLAVLSGAHTIGISHCTSFTIGISHCTSFTIGISFVMQTRNATGLVAPAIAASLGA
ncbi:hypothetical protein ACSBR2_005855 [Camellia fascicularis]